MYARACRIWWLCWQMVLGVMAIALHARIGQLHPCNFSDRPLCARVYLLFTPLGSLATDPRFLTGLCDLLMCVKGMRTSSIIWPFHACG